MKTITTTHSTIGYRNNVEIIEQALRSRFGFEDNSHVLTAVAAHVWSELCQTQLGGDEKRWGTREVTHALAACRYRLDTMQTALARVDPEACAADPLNSTPLPVATAGTLAKAR